MRGKRSQDGGAAPSFNQAGAALGPAISDTHTAFQGQGLTEATRWLFHCGRGHARLGTPQCSGPHLTGASPLP